MFQQLMECTMGDMNLIEVLVYLDNIIVFGQTLGEHRARLEKVFARRYELGFKLPLEKCQLFQTSVTYFGHFVSAKVIAAYP